MGIQAEDAALFWSWAFSAKNPAAYFQQTHNRFDL